MKLARKRESVSDLSSESTHRTAAPSGNSWATRCDTTGGGAGACRVATAGCMAK